MFGAAGRGLGTGAKYAGMGLMSGVHSLVGLGGAGLMGLGRAGQIMGRQWKPGLTGGLAGLLSGGPMKGMISGAMTGLFTGGAPGAVVGAVTGGIGGTIGMGIHMLTEGLGTAVNLTKELVSHTISLGMEYQKNVAYFSAFTGGLDSSRELMTRLQSVALASPFKFNQLTGSASLLMGYGISPTETPAVTGRLAMMAGGDESRLQRLSLAYAQVLSHGRFMGQELRQFAEAGVGAPDFARTMGVDTAEFKRMMHEGQVGPNVVIETVNRLTSAGGRFTNVNDALLNTVGGRWNQFLEGIEIRLGKLGDRLFTKMGVSDVLGGMAAGMGPFMDDLTEKLMPALEWIWNTGGYVLQPLIESGQALISVGNDIWNSGFGKMLLPQTWNEATSMVLSFGAVVSGVFGSLLDAQRFALVQFGKATKPILVSLMMAKKSLGMDVSGDMQNIINMTGDEIDYNKSPDKYRDMFATPWTKAIQNFVSGADPWEKFRSGGQGSIDLPTISIPIVVPEDTKKFISEARDALRDGFTPLDEFVDGPNGLIAIAKAIDPLLYTGDRAKMEGIGGVLMGGLGVFGAGATADAMGMSQEAAAVARWNAYQRLKANFQQTDSFRLPSGVMADTQEALQTVIESSNMAPTQDIQAEIKDVLDKANEQRDRQLKELEELNRYFKENSVRVGIKKVG